MYLLFIWFQGLAFLSLGSRSPSGQLPAILQLHRVSEVLYPLICWTTSDHLCTTTYIRTQERFSQIPRIRQFSHHTFNKCKPWCQSDGIMSDSAMCPISFKHPHPRSVPDTTSSTSTGIQRWSTWFPQSGSQSFWSRFCSTSTCPHC